jgi:hypothetical protein
MILGRVHCLPRFATRINRILIFLSFFLFLLTENFNHPKVLHEDGFSSSIHLYFWLIFSSIFWWSFFLLGAQDMGSRYMPCNRAFLRWPPPGMTELLKWSHRLLIHSSDSFSLTDADGSVDLLWIPAKASFACSGMGRPCLVYKNFRDFLSHGIFRHMYGALNVDENKKLITQFGRKTRDESFEPN